MSEKEPRDILPILSQSAVEARASVADREQRVNLLNARIGEKGFAVRGAVQQALLEGEIDFDATEQQIDADIYFYEQNGRLPHLLIQRTTLHIAMTDETAITRPKRRK